MDPAVIDAAARALDLPGWDAVEPFRGGRAAVALATSGTSRVVLKAYGEQRGARERAALLALDGAAGVPRLLASGDEPAWAALTLLEGDTTLADALLGEDPSHASALVVAWAQALARLHTAAATPAVRHAFVDELARRAPGLAPRTLADDIAAAVASYAAVLGELGLPSYDDAMAELTALPGRLSDEEVLSPADTCPDNALVGPDGTVRLLDLEFAELRHAAWDVAYLCAPWPSCWCAWRLPEEVTDAGLAAYAATRAVPEGFAEDVRLATLGWCVLTPGLFLRGALASDDADGPADRPSRRAFVLHRLGQAAAAGEGALSAFAGDLHLVLRGRWGDVPLPLAPAFR